VTKYSAQSQELARELAERAAAGLRRSGHTVIRDSSTGQYTVTRSANDARHGNTSEKTPKTSPWHQTDKR
jgi:hypothetical protein